MHDEIVVKDMGHSGVSKGELIAKIIDDDDDYKPLQTKGMTDELHGLLGTASGKMQRVSVA